MGQTAENIAAASQLSREDLYQFALESQQKAARAIEPWVFSQEIVPVEVPGRRGPTLFSQDQ
jgi:acetyl-CoA C-acetyltransferase